MISENRLHKPGFALCVRLGVFHKAALARAAKGSGLAPQEMAAAMARNDRIGTRLRRRLYSEVIAICGEKERRRLDHPLNIVHSCGLAQKEDQK